MDRIGPPRYSLQFSGPVGEGNQVRAGLLVQALGSLQNAVLLLGMAEERAEVIQRVRVTEALAQRYAVLCDTPEAGSFVQPYRIGRPGFALFDAGLVEAVTRRHEEVLRAIDRGDEDALIDAVPDGFYRSRVIEALLKMQPPERSGIVLHVGGQDRGRLLDGHGAAAKLRSMVARRSEPLVSPGIVTGILIELRFQDRMLRLQVVPDGHAITATYADDFEPILLQNPRQLVQLRGNIVFDERGRPGSVTQVDAIVELDTSAVTLERFVFEAGSYHAQKPIVFDVSFDRERGEFDCIGPFGIVAAAATRAGVEDAVDAEVRMLWAEYALAADDELSGAAIALKRELLSSFRAD